MRFASISFHITIAPSGNSSTRKWNTGTRSQRHSAPRGIGRPVRARTRLILTATAPASSAPSKTILTRPPPSSSSSTWATISWPRRKTPTSRRPRRALKNWPESSDSRWKIRSDSSDHTDPIGAILSFGPSTDGLVFVCGDNYHSPFSSVSAPRAPGETHRKEPNLAGQERDPRAYELMTIFLPELSDEDGQAQIDAVPSAISEIERDLKLDTNTMRYLLVHDDPKAGERFPQGEGAAENQNGEEPTEPASGAASGGTRSAASATRAGSQTTPPEATSDAGGAPVRATTGAASESEPEIATSKEGDPATTEAAAA